MVDEPFKIVIAGAMQAHTRSRLNNNSIDMSN
jgi:hypothetical protein